MDGAWSLALEGAVQADGPAAAALADLRAMTASAFGFTFASRNAGGPALVFALKPKTGKQPGRWDRSFTLEARPDGVRIQAASEGALLRASLFLSNYWRLRRVAALPLGRRRFRPAIPIHIGADLWGGFNTTQAWIDGRETDANFIELARMGVTHVPVMTLLEDYIADAPAPFRSLIHPRAAANRRRLARLVEAAARHDIAILLMAYNPKLPPDHPVFAACPTARGALQAIWDYSMSGVSASARCRRQRALARGRGLPFSVKIECGNSIECLNVPWLPALENQAAIWNNARRLKPQAVHSRWLFDGSCKNPSEELGFWTIWGRNTDFDRTAAVLKAIARRDFGDAAAPLVQSAWRDFSEGLRHHPCLHYYTGSYFIGPAQPLVLETKAIDKLDRAFFGRFYWEWETSSSRDASSLIQGKPLFFRAPAFRALARRGPDRGRDVGLQELQALAGLWERGARKMAQAGKRVPACCRVRHRQEWILGQHLAYTWRSAANVEEFLRLRDTIREFDSSPSLRAGHARENLRDLARMTRIAREELKVAREDLVLVRGVDFLDLSLRLDMGTASLEAMLQAKIRQVGRLLKIDLPRRKNELLKW